MERIRRECNCDVIAGQPQVAYRESITKRAEIAYTHKKQTGGSGQYAKIAGYMKPLPPDAVESYEFVDDITGGSIPKEFIPSCDKSFRESVKKGQLIGFPVVGIRVALDDGAAHAVDSSEMAFKSTAIMGFREGDHLRASGDGSLRERGEDRGADPRAGGGGEVERAHDDVGERGGLRSVPLPERASIALEPRARADRPVRRRRRTAPPRAGTICARRERRRELSRLSTRTWSFQNG